MTQSLSKPLNKRIVGLIVAATVATGAIAFYGISQFATVGVNKSSQPAQSIPIVKKITALGRLEPAAEVIELSAPLALDGDRVAQLLVEEGDLVQGGQTVAILDSRDRLQDELHRRRSK